MSIPAITMSSILIPGLGLTATIPVSDGSSFPNFSYLLISDNVAGAWVGQVTAGGSTLSLTVKNLFITKGVYGQTMAASSIITASGPPEGASFTTSSITIPASGTSVTVPVVQNIQFPAQTYVSISDNVHSMYGLVTTSNASSSVLIVTNLQGLYTGTTLLSAAIVAFSGPQGQVGLTGYQGLTGPTGPTGAAGPGPSTTTSAVQIVPIGSLSIVNVVNSAAFPVLSYVTISNGVNAIVGQVIATPPGVPSVANQFYIMVASIINGSVGSVLPIGSFVNSAGPPGPSGSILLGAQGTALYTEILLNYGNNSFFNSGFGVQSSATIGTLTYTLPTTLNVNWKVIVDLTATVSTGQSPSSNIVYLGIGNTSPPSVNNTLSAATFAGGGTFPSNVIQNGTVVSDGVYTASTALNPNNSISTVTRYTAIYGPGLALAFTVLGAAVAQNATFYVNGYMSLTMYPVYGYN